MSQNTKVIRIDKWKEAKEQNRLRNIMLERFGTIEAELEAFLAFNNEDDFATYILSDGRDTEI